MKKKFERINQLLDIIKSEKNISVKELAALLEVSEMTIRRDIEVLKDKGYVNTLYGSVIYTGTTSLNLNDSYHLGDAKGSHNEEKARIGAFAATLVENGDILIIDTGSTTEALARSLNPDLDITVLCYNHNILYILLQKPNINLIFSGGYYHSNTQMFESREGLSLIKSTRATKVFISAAGIHKSLGVTCANNYEIATKHAIFNSSVDKILLADSSKFSTVKSSWFAGVEDFDMIITDSGISPEWIAYIQDLNIPLHVV